MKVLFGQKSREYEELSARVANLTVRVKQAEASASDWFQKFKQQAETADKFANRYERLADYNQSLREHIGQLHAAYNRAVDVGVIKPAEPEEQTDPYEVTEGEPV